MTAQRREAPYTFAEAIDVARLADEQQRASERDTRIAYGTLADAEREYRLALALKITDLRNHGFAITLAADLARGDEEVARLRHARDLAEGVVEAAKQAGWRNQANRRDAHEFISWSSRRDLAEGYHGAAQPAQFESVNPGRAT